MTEKPTSVVDRPINYGAVAPVSLATEKEAGTANIAVGSGAAAVKATRTATFQTTRASDCIQPQLTQGVSGPSD